MKPLLQGMPLANLRIVVQRLDVRISVDPPDEKTLLIALVLALIYLVGMRNKKRWRMIEWLIGLLRRFWS